MKLLDAVTAPVVGEPHFNNNVSQLAPASHTISIKTTGAPTAVTMKLYGLVDQDGTSITALEYPFDAGDISAGEAIIHLADKPLTGVKAELTVLTGGTTPTVTVYYTKGR